MFKVYLILITVMLAQLKSVALIKGVYLWVRLQAQNGQKKNSSETLFYSCSQKGRILHVAICMLQKCEKISCNGVY